MCKLCKQPIGPACVSVEANKCKKEAEKNNNMRDEYKTVLQYPLRISRHGSFGRMGSPDPGPMTFGWINRLQALFYSIPGDDRPSLRITISIHHEKPSASIFLRWPCHYLSFETSTRYFVCRCRCCHIGPFALRTLSHFDAIAPSSSLAERQT